MAENKKIKNAKEEVYDNIKFRSRLELNCYKLLKEANLDFTYESEKIVLWEGFKIGNIRVFVPDKKKDHAKILIENNSAIRDMTYTPDFKVVCGNNVYYIESKGIQNDTYPIKKKMFLKILDNRNDGYKYYFIEPHNLKQMNQALELIKENGLT